MTKNGISSGKGLALVGIILLSAMLFMADTSFAADDAAVEAIQYRIKGYVYQRQGDFNRAMENYKKAIERYPFYACAYNDLGILYEQEGRFEKAEELYLKTIEIDPEYVSAYTNLAALYERLGRFDTACYYWEKRSQMGDPNDRWTINAKRRYNELCYMLAEQEKDRRLKTTRKSVRKPAKSEEEAEFTEASGLAKELASVKASEKVRAQRNAREKEKIDKQCQDYRECADRLMKKGNYDSAIRQYKKIQAIAPDYPNINRLIDEAQEAKIEKEKQLKLQAEKERQARNEDRLGRQELLEKERLDNEQKRQKEKLERKQQQVSSAAPSQDEKTKRKIEGMLNKAQDYIADRKYSLALEQYYKAEKLDPDFPNLKSLISKAEKAKFDYESEKKSKQDQERFLREQEKERKEQQKLSEQINAYFAKAQEYLSKGKYDTAISYYKKVGALDPDYPGLAGMIDSAENAKSAKAPVKPIFEQESAQSRMQEVVRQKDQERLKKQQQAEERARLEKQRQQEQRGSKKEEELKLKQQSKRQPLPPKQKQQEQDKLKKQQEAQQKKLKAEQERKLPGLPRYQARTGKEQQAEQAKIEAQKKSLAKEAETSFKRGNDYMAKGKYDQAIAEYEKIKKTDPQQAAEADNLIKRAKQANQQQEADQKEQQRFKEADQHFTRGQSLYLAGKYDEATRELELALSLNPNHSNAYRVLRYCQRRTQKGYYRPLQEAVSEAGPEIPLSIQRQPAAQQPLPQKPQAVPVQAIAEPAVPEYKTPPAESPSSIEKRISQEVQKEAGVSGESTSADIEKKYQVIGVVAYRSEAGNISTLNDELLKKAKAMGAEEVIQVKYFQHNNFIYGYGTAVKKKKK